MKVVLIGTGRMGRRHLSIAKSVGLEVVGLCDAHLPSAQEAAEAENLTGCRVGTDVEEVLKSVRPEVVIIATTAPTHCEFTCLAAEMGAKYILCEKPMATSLADCRRMTAACVKAGTRLAINHQMRFMEQYTIPKSLLESPAYGGLTSVNVLAGNFGLAMNGSHYFEMFRFMTGENPHTVNAWFSNEVVPNPRGPQFADRAGCVRITTAGGKRFYLDASADQGHGMQVVYGAKYGHIYVDEILGAMRAVVREEAHRELPTTRYGMPATLTESTITPADAFAPTRAVLEALLNTAADPPGAEAGQLAVNTLLAAHLSHERGGAGVTLEEAGALAADRIFPWA